MRMDPATCEYVLVIIVVVCVCSLGMCVGVYVGGCPGEVGKRDVICCDNLNYGFKNNLACLFIIFNSNAVEDALMFFLRDIY